MPDPTTTPPAAPARPAAPGALSRALSKVAPAEPRPSPSQLLRASSRTFAIGIERLGPSLREPIRTSYLLLRVSDFIEDHPDLPAAERARLLTLWDAVLGRSTELAELEEQLECLPSAGPDAVVARNARLVVHALDSFGRPERDCVVRNVRLSTQGMARWALRGPDFATEGDLDEYMHEVAGRVGWLLTELFALHSASIRRRSDRLLPLAREFGLGLQTVNVIRGLPSDRARGWIYIPECFVADLSVSRSELFEESRSEAALVALQRLAAKADRHLRAAEEYVTLLPRHRHPVRVFCLLPLFFAIATLRVSRNDPSVFRTEVRIGRAEVQRIVRETQRWGWSNDWIRGASARIMNSAS